MALCRESTPNARMAFGGVERSETQHYIKGVDTQKAQKSAESVKSAIQTTQT